MRLYRRGPADRSDQLRTIKKTEKLAFGRRFVPLSKRLQMLYGKKTASTWCNCCANSSSERKTATMIDGYGPRRNSNCPTEWATIQNNLGNAYWRRTRGQPADNVERAIVAYKSALQVRTRTADPYGWARTQNNLGNVYAQRVRGTRA